MHLASFNVIMNAHYSSSFRIVIVMINYSFFSLSPVSQVFFSVSVFWFLLNGLY